MHDVTISKNGETLYFDPDTKRFAKSRPTRACSQSETDYATTEHAEFWNGLGFSLVVKPKGDQNV